VSLVVVFSWLVSVLSIEGVMEYLPSFSGLLTSLGILAVAPIVALPITSVVARPLGPLFTPKAARGNDDLVGKICVVRTGSVDATFGEATLEDGGAGVVVRVRVDPGASLKRGDKALIVSWDKEREAFTVESMTDVLTDEADGAKKSDRRA
jgi:hypothetical protein